MSISKPLFITPYTVPLDWNESTSIECKDASLTVQADRDQADINFIVKQFGLTHELPYGNEVPEFADYSDIPNDYQQALAFIEDSRESFMQYPAEMRARFNNNPALLLDFLQSDTNRDEAIALGIISPPPDDGGGSIPPASGGGDNP